MNVAPGYIPLHAQYLQMSAHYSSLLRFAGLILREHRTEMGDVEGAFIQEAALKCGLLETRSVTEACSEGCSCMEVVDPKVDSPWHCHFETPLGEAAREEAINTTS